MSKKTPQKKNVPPSLKNRNVEVLGRWKGGGGKIFFQALSYRERCDGQAAGGTGGSWNRFGGNAGWATLCPRYRKRGSGPDGGRSRRLAYGALSSLRLRKNAAWATTHGGRGTRLQGGKNGSKQVGGGERRVRLY